MTTTPAPTTSTGLKNAVTQPLTSQYKTVATGTATTAKPTVPVQVSADLHVDPKDADLLEPASVVTQEIDGYLEHGKRSATNAIVLHMTGGGAPGTLDKYMNKEKKKFVAGAHFLITKTGEIIQTAKLSYETSHVGPVRPKGYRPNGDNNNTEIKSLLTDDEIHVLRKAHTTFTAKKNELHDLQMKKSYKSDMNDKDSRLPYNGDSIGIEFEALDDEATKPKSQTNVKYDSLTEKQITSGKRLVKFLKDYYKLTDADIFEHPDISYKTRAEAHGAKEDTK